MEENIYQILVINPGSTSTKVALFKNEECTFVTNIQRDVERLHGFESIAAQYAYRKNCILQTLEEQKIELSTVVAVIGRGGLLKPIPSGVYWVNEAMKADLKRGIQGQHAANLGGLIADDIASTLPHAKAYIADPVVVDELQPVARFSGLPSMPRKSIFHALNQKAVARRYAATQHKAYEQMRLIVAHLGGGVSIGAHAYGSVIDVNNALDGEGPFSPERSGTVPFGDLIAACYSGKNKSTILRSMIGRGGLVAYFGTNDLQKVRERALAGDSQANAVLEAMAYNISKYIGATAVVLEGRVDAIILTGGMAFDQYLVEAIKQQIQFIAPTVIMPGEDEMQALAENALRAILHPNIVKQYC